MLYADLMEDLSKIGSFTWAGVAALFLGTLVANRKALLAAWERRQKANLAAIEARNKQLAEEREHQENLRSVQSDRHEKQMEAKDRDSKEMTDRLVATIKAITDSNERRLELVVTTWSEECKLQRDQSRDESRLERQQCQEQFREMMQRTDSLIRSHDQVQYNLNWLVDHLGRKPARGARRQGPSEPASGEGTGHEGAAD